MPDLSLRSRIPTLFTITLSVKLNAVLHCSHLCILLGQSLFSSLLTNWYCLPLILSGSKKSSAGFPFDELFLTYKKKGFRQLHYSTKGPIGFHDKGLFHPTRDSHNNGPSKYPFHIMLQCYQKIGLKHNTTNITMTKITNQQTKKKHKYTNQ